LKVLEHKQKGKTAYTKSKENAKNELSQIGIPSGKATKSDFCIEGMILGFILKTSFEYRPFSAKPLKNE
jgi:hypothetical protein